MKNDVFNDFHKKKHSINKKNKHLWDIHCSFKKWILFMLVLEGEKIQNILKSYLEKPCKCECDVIFKSQIHIRAVTTNLLLHGAFTGLY